jgi:hypothetical protein
VDETELVQGAEPAPAFVDQIEAPPAREPAAIADAEPALATARTEGSAASFDGDTVAAVKPQETFRAAFRSTFQDSFLPQVELPQSHRLMRKSSAAQAASTALREVAARTFLPEVDMGSDRRGLNAEPARGVSLTAAMPAAELAATLEPEQPVAGLATDTHPAEPPGSDLPGVPEGVEAAQIALAAPAELIESLAALPPAAAPVQPAAAARPQAPSGDPLAALKAMSEHELLALFG